MPETTKPILSGKPKEETVMAFKNWIQGLGAKLGFKKSNEPIEYWREKAYEFYGREVPDE